MVVSMPHIPWLPQSNRVANSQRLFPVAEIPECDRICPFVNRERAGNTKEKSLAHKRSFIYNQGLLSRQKSRGMDLCVYCQLHRLQILILPTNKTSEYQI